MGKSVLKRRYPHLFPKNAAEVILIRIPYISGNVTDAFIGLGEKLAGGTDSQTNDILVGGHSCVLPESSAEGSTAHMFHLS